MLPRLEELLAVAAAVGVYLAGRGALALRHRRGAELHAGAVVWRSIVLAVALFGAAVMGMAQVQKLGMCWREATIVKLLREALDAHEAYARRDGGYFDMRECMRTPRRGCGPSRGASGRLEALLVPSYERVAGYDIEYVAGPEVTPMDGASPRLARYAYRAVPHPWQGRRGFCADSSGQVYYAVDAVPEAQDGRCAPGSAVEQGSVWRRYYIWP